MTPYAVEFGASAAGWWAAAAAVAAAAWHARKSPAGSGLLALRGLAALMLVLILLKPSLARKEMALLKPKLAVLIDNSHSMKGKAGTDNRFDTARRWLLKHRRAVEERAEPVFYAVAGRGRRLSGWEELEALEPSEAAFQPGDCLRDVAGDPESSQAQRAWLVSDGNAEPGADLEKALGALKLPLDALGVGPSRRGRGVGFLEIKTPDFAFLHGRFSVETTAEVSGLAGESLRLRLLRREPGSAGSWSLVDEKAWRPVSAYETFAASFSAAAQTLGSESYRLEVASPREGSQPLHARELRVEVIRQKYRIMYLAGRPSPEYAYLREFLKSDPNHELVSFVILRNPENPPWVSDNELSLIPFPAQEIFVQTLSQFDLFILENFSYKRFQLPPAYLDSLKSFVAAGGALLVVGGENAFGLGGYRGTALEEMLPAALSEASPDFVNGLFAAKPASRGHPLVELYDSPEASRAAWEALPPLDGWARFKSVRPGATVLAVHPQERTEAGEPLPVMALREYGRGKVMLVSSDSTWRWRLGAASDWRVGSFYARFWSRAVQYLTGNLDLSKVRFAPLPDRLVPREPAVFPLRVFDENFRPAESASTEVAVLWTSPDGKTRELLPRESQPGVFSVELTGLSPGAHRLRARAKVRGRPWGEDQIAFRWEAPSARAPMDRRWLKRAADLGGGAFVDLAAADVEALLSKLPPVVEESEVARRYYPWLSPLWLWLTAGLFLAEWGLRRWKGHP